MVQDDKMSKLFTGFPPISTPEWEQAILKDLKGADYAKKLIWTSPEGIPVRPYYRAEDLDKLNSSEFNPMEFGFINDTEGRANGWLIRQDIDVTDYDQAKDKCRYLLSHGVESIGFKMEDPHIVEEVREFLKDLPLEEAEFSFEGFVPMQILAVLNEMADSGKLDPEKIHGSCQWDMLGDFSLYGSFEFDEDEELAEVADWIHQAARFPGLKIIGVTGRNFHQAGSTIAQELAYSLAQANEYLAELTEIGVPAELVARKISFHFAIGSNYFMEIAKFRAARMLWVRILEGHGIQKDQLPAMYIHAETSRWNQTVYDPYVNLLRNTTEAMSAALAGIDSMTVLPFDYPYEEPTEFAERIARNQQIVLREEAHFDKVADPAGGSYYIESLTSSIAEVAWKLFQDVEDSGGYTDAFYEGKVQDAIVTAAFERDRNIAQRKEILLGTNQYPNPAEEMLPKVDTVRLRSKVMDTNLAEAQPMNLYRASEEFESIRFETERSGKKPVVFMLTTGHLAVRKARATFACNFFGCAGYTVIDNPGFATLAEGVDAAMKAKADIVVLCSSDSEYATLGVPFAGLLRMKAIPVIAGYPKEIIDQLKSAGIQHFIHVRSNVSATLKAFNALILKE
ncbi:MAG: methylmalonyl-CoA mutase small subunit [Porphyromonadaceae bacterium]|nr:MAG: methylmalonyl-CoA mutase small subunit [Porphyromonadaceae bacterium]